jgi:1-acyl-sn-glycerol-3-phosphate acyltransferase
MTEAKHAGWAERIFRPYILRLMRKHFHAVHFIGELADTPRGKPLLVVANHGTWWDGFFIYLLNKQILHRKLYMMMLEEQLAKYPFFRRLGAFGVEQGRPRAIMSSLAYSAAVLKDPSNLLCIFPQGAMRHVHTRPLGFQRGLQRVLAMYGGVLSVLPVAMACEFMDNQRPEVFLLSDRVYEVNASTFPGVEWLERTQETQMDRLEQAIAVREQGRILLGGRRSVSRTWDAVKESFGTRR